MVQIIQENKRPSFLQSLASGTAKNLEKGLSMYMQGNALAEQRSDQKAALEQKMNHEMQMQQQQYDLQRRNQADQLAGKGDPEQSANAKFQRDMQLMQQKYDLERRNQSDLLNGKELDKANQKSIENQQNVAPFMAGLETISEMRNLGRKGNLGRGSSIMGMFGGETARDRGQYEQLGKSLISLASTIPIRNQKEFETLSANLFDPSIQDEEREGILDAMENIIRRNMQQYLPQEEQQQGSQQAKPTQAKRPPLKSFHR